MEKIEQALLPCPFCGGTNVSVHGPYGWHSQYCISHSCKAFYAGAQEAFKGYPTKSYAISAWNNRPPAETLPPLAAALRARAGGE